MKQKETVGFVFQEIDLSEAQTIVAAGDGKYSDLVVMLSAKLPELEEKNRNLPLSEQKSFAFGLPGGKEIDEKDRRGLCHTLNLRMKSAGVHWKTHYSGNKKLFICVPLRNADKVVSRNRYLTGEKREAVVARIKALYQQGMKNPDIAKEMGMNLSSVNYCIYEKNKTRQSKKAAIRASAPNSFSPGALVAMARIVLNFNETDLTSRSHGHAFRQAVATVGMRDLHFTGQQMDETLGNKRGASNYIVLHGVQDVKKEIALLRQALHQKGVIQ